ncbi:MAG: hypothetical protein ACI8WY_002801, partial [Planctomycetota bacterium]
MGAAVERFMETSLLIWRRRYRSRPVSKGRGQDFSTDARDRWQRGRVLGTLFARKYHGVQLETYVLGGLDR